jgi:predicted phage baseplate assembly protein
VYLTVEVGSDGQFKPWKKQETLLYSYSNDPHFTVQINENDEAEIVFGDGTYGRIPSLNSTIRATYLIGGGASGNVGPNTITKVKSGVATASGGRVSIEVTNKKAASGGADRESIANARQQAPGIFRSRQRAVTQEDYVALAENFPGVARAIAIPATWNYVDLYVVAAGNFELTQDLHDQLLADFEKKRMVTTFVNVRSPVFVTIEITIDELGVEPTFYGDDVEQRAREALAALFEMERLKFGQSFYLSKIYEALENVPGVDFVRGVSFQGSRSQPPAEVVEAENGLIQLQPREFPRPSAGLVNFESITGGLGRANP